MDYKSTLTQAFIVEIRGEVGNIKDVIGGMRDEADAERLREQDKDDRELLMKLLPPASSSFEEKVTCLSGTREKVLEVVKD